MTVQAVTSWPAAFPLTGPRLIQPAHIIPVAVDKRHLAAEWQALSTQRIMTLHLPAETLGLVRDVTPLPSGQMFPDELKMVEHADPHVQGTLGKITFTHLLVQHFEP